MIHPGQLDSEWPQFWFDELGSTSTEARNRVSNGELGPFWIAAKAQTAGRGRRGNDWQSPIGNLYATALFPVDDDTAELATLSLAIALAVRSLIEDLTGGQVQPQLKWPNDVRVDRAKLCGILMETGGRIQERWMSIGIGVNLASSPDLPDYPTVNLKALTATAPDPEIALKRLDHHLRQELEMRLRFGRQNMIDRWMVHAEGVGGPARARMGEQTLEGKFLGLSEDGHLRLQLENGTTHLVTAGDVELLKEVPNASGH